MQASCRKLLNSLDAGRKAAQEAATEKHEAAVKKSDAQEAASKKAADAAKKAADAEKAAVEAEYAGMDERTKARYICKKDKTDGSATPAEIKWVEDWLTSVKAPAREFPSWKKSREKMGILVLESEMDIIPLMAKAEAGTLSRQEIDAIETFCKKQGAPRNMWPDLSKSRRNL